MLPFYSPLIRGLKHRTLGPKIVTWPSKIEPEKERWILRSAQYVRFDLPPAWVQLLTPASVKFIKTIRTGR
jgi:hypothetical protein